MFVCLVSESIFTAYLHSSRGDVLFFAIKNFTLIGCFSTVIFRVMVRVVYFEQVCLMKQVFCLLSKPIVALEISSN